MKQTITVITGKVARDIFGSYEDCSPGLYIDSDKIESVFAMYYGKDIKITIEVIES